jgi:GTP pyrophosphokinase
MSALTDRFDAALALAHRVHRQQLRKGTSIPYIAHILGVTSIALEYGANETEAIAAVLHDTIEDATPDMPAGLIRQLIREQFGDAVLAIVEHCTDTDVQPKPPWRARKLGYLEHLRTAPRDAMLVSASDKLHNVRSLLRDYRAVGDRLWDRFNKEAGRDGTLGYYRALLDAFSERLDNPIVAELQRTLEALEREAGGRSDWPAGGGA